MLESRRTSRRRRRDPSRSTRSRKFAIATIPREPWVTMRYWINTVSRSHVQNGVEGGFTQADHGKVTRLRRLAKGDRIVFYSPRQEMRAGERLQRFTAIGEIIDEEPYEVEMSWRRRMRIVSSVEVPIRPLIDQLEFIRD